jgi:argininosuccinate synthase
MQKILLAYSGGGHSSAAIAWLSQRYNAEVVALTLDIGQGGDLEAVRDSALALGAIRAHVLDVRDEFARHFLVPALKADVLYSNDREGQSRASLLSRPLIAQKLVEISAIEQTTAVAHASAADQPHIGLAIQALNPSLEVIAVSADLPAPGGGWTEAVDRHAMAAKSPGECPDEAAFVEITFSRGTPTAINAVAMPLVDLIGSLDIIAGANGVGRYGSLESPAATVLDAAHEDLQAVTITGEAGEFSKTVSEQFAGAIERGAWFSPLRDALAAYVDKIQVNVTGVVRLRLFKGDCTVVEHRAAAPEPATATPVHKMTFTATAKA